MTDLYDQAANVPRDLALGRRPEVAFLDRLYAIRRMVPSDALFAFHTAATLHGFGVLESPTIHVTVPAGCPVPQIHGVSAHQHAFPITGCAQVLGLACVPAPRCAIDLARTAGRGDALAILDATLRLAKHDGALLDEAALWAEAALHNGHRGIRQVRELLKLADGRAECRQESHLRLVIHDARLPPPVPQYAVLDEAGWVRYRIGLAYEEERVGIEYDGSARMDRRRPRVDRIRHNWLARHGWALRYFTEQDLYERPGLIVPAIRQTLRARRSRRR